MYKLIRFYNQNREKVFKIILIIVFIIGIIQLLNYFAKKNQNSNNNIQKNNIITNSESKQELVSNKSAISGESVSETSLEKATDVIAKFFKYCNEGNIESAYGILTEECKEVMFPTIKDFKNIYYLDNFNGENKTYTVENWVGDIYQVKITGDILSTGKLDDGKTKQDYMTVVKDDGDYKLNINSYVGREDVNKVTENKNIKITIQSIDTYMDYEIYNLSIQNNSENDILLDTSDDTKSVYLLDSKKMKYYFYSNEVIQSKLKVQSKYTNNLQIKFTNSYSSSRTIKNVVFSKMILNYDEYSNGQDKSQYNNFYEFKVNV